MAGETEAQHYLGGNSQVVVVVCMCVYIHMVVVCWWWCVGFLALPPFWFLYMLHSSPGEGMTKQRL